MSRPRRVELGLPDGVGRAGVFDHPSLEPGQAGVLGGGHRLRIRDQVVIVHMGHGPALVPVHTDWQFPHDVGLEVEHQEPADERVLDTGQNEESGGLHRTAGQDDMAGVLGPRLPVRPDPLDARRPSVGHQDPVDKRFRPQLGPTGEKGALQHGHRVTLGMNGAAEVGTEAAVVAGRPPVIGNGIGGGRARIRVITEPFGRRGAEQGAKHGCTRRHRIRP